MINFINKNKLLATTAICAISVCANTVKAEEISILDILNNSTTKSPDITWIEGQEGEENIVQILDKFYKYIVSDNPTRTKYDERKTYLTGDVKGDFIGIEYKESWGSGGAIYNKDGGTISSITGDFTSNSATGENTKGGAIYNAGTITSITGNFIGNSAIRGRGGAIYNYYGTIETITGDFIGNSTPGYYGTDGGAIYNYYGTIETITGDFIGNSTFGDGGAIMNYGTINNIVGDFIGNRSSSGGAILNGGTIKSITGDFIGNEGSNDGAIYNAGIITLVADGSLDTLNSYEQDVLFENNNSNVYSQSTAIFNFYNGIINFESRNGGSFTFYDIIQNQEGYINLIGDGNLGVLNIYNNINSSDNWGSQRGVINIQNPYVFNMINQDINYVEQEVISIETASTLNLDVILSTGKSDRFNITEEVTGSDNFTLDKINLVDDMDGIEYEKVIYSNQKLTGNEFTREQSTSKGKYSIVNDGQNLIITKVGESLGFAAFLADVNDKYTEDTYSFTEDEDMKHVLIDGLDVTGEVNDSKTDITVFGNNYTLSYLLGESSKAMNLQEGQTAEINNLTIKGFETGLINKGNMTLNNVTLKDNKIALKNESKLTFQGENTISGGDYAMYFEAGKSYEFILSGILKDYQFVSWGYQNYNSYEEYMKEQSEYLSDWFGYPVEITNGAEYWEAYTSYYEQQGYETYSDLEILRDEGWIFRSEYYDEVLEVLKEYGKDHPSIGYFAINLTCDYISPLKFAKFSFMEEGAEKEALLDDIITDIINSGWASEEDIDYYKGYIREQALKISELDAKYAQYQVSSPCDYVVPPYKETTLTFKEDAILNLNSKISGGDVYGLTLAGSDDAIINLNSEIEKADLVLDGPTLKLSDESTNLASVNSFEVKNGTLDLQNEVVRTLVASNFKISGALKLFVDADLANKKMDTLGEVEVLDSASISVDGIKILSDATDVETLVEFAGESYKDKVTTTVDNVLSAKYTYAVTYDATTGKFKFVRAEEKAPEEVAPNQAPVLSTTTTVATVETVVAQIFERDVTISADTNYGVDTTDYMETSDGVNIHNNNSVWVKTFGSDDDVEVENFSNTIDAEAYGVVGGVDSKVFTYDNGVKAAYGIYGAYVGGKQKYNDSKIEQKSGYLGVSASFRKNNLFSNFTLNGGYITSEANTAWGKDKFDTKVVSVANKTGVDIKTYNNWKITPALYVAYTGMDTEDYTNKAGVKMENEFSNVITIAPELKVSNRIGKDLDGYAKVSYKHYIYDAEVKADDVLLEEMSAKPYVEYGFGVEKNWADKSGYAEITRRSGGREGWNINLGLNFDF